jgi:hypothetical protein
MGAGTVCGTIPLEAGKKNAELVPLTAERTISSVKPAEPVSRSAASTPWLAPLTRLDPTMTR